ncbi:MAG: rhodanese-like domain-containing protein [Burkholderiales bacterium]
MNLFRAGHAVGCDAVLIHVVTQNRSSAAAKELRSRGFTNVKYVRGGMSEWARRGWTLESLAKP